MGKLLTRLQDPRTSPEGRSSPSSSWRSYRIGFHIPLPMIDQAKLGEKMANAQTGAFGQVLGFVSMFSGGNLSQACIFSLGIMPYISASIIIQLLSSGVLPSPRKSSARKGKAAARRSTKSHAGSPSQSACSGRCS